MASRRLSVLHAHLVGDSEGSTSRASPNVLASAPEISELNASYKGPLHGLVVLDLTQMVSGPMGTQLLGDQGADIIKVEPVGAGAAERGASKARIVSSLYAIVGRNKRSVAIDLKTPKGLAALLRLVPKADVLVQNFRPGVAEQMGIGCAAMRRLNERLIYCSISGFGKTGPYSGKRVYDPVIQAASGLTSMQADETGRPRMMRLIVPDKVTALTSAQAITAAVVQRYRTGKGCHIELSMLDSVISFSWAEGFAQESFVDPPQAPDYTYRRDLVYQTRDGYITCGAVQDKEWRALCTALKKPEWIDDERFKTAAARAINFTTRLNLTEEVLKTMTTQEALARLAAEQVPSGVIHHPRSNVLQDPQVVQNGLIKTWQHPWAPQAMRQPRMAAQFDDEEWSLRRHAPLLGEHTLEVLRDLGGMSPEELAALKSEGVIEEVQGRKPVQNKARDPRLSQPLSG